MQPGKEHPSTAAHHASVADGKLPALPEPGGRLSAADVEQIEARVAREVTAVTDIEALQEWRAKAAALDVYLRSRGLRAPMLGAQRRIEARIGQLGLAYHGKHGINNKILAEFGVLAKALSGSIMLADDEWRQSRRQLVVHLRGRFAEGKPQTVETCTIDDLTAFASDIQAGRRPSCGTIYADPPWAYDNQSTRAATKNHYRTMTVEQLCALPVARIAADDGHLHLWTTNGFLFEAPKIFAAWGFEFKSTFVWVKPKLGIGNYWRNAHEILLTGVRGDAKRFNDHSLISWLECQRGPHSEKPEQIRSFIERASPGPRLEMFGRKAVDGWYVWGDQIERSLFTRQVEEVA
jgi:N6-adenosine-specific RNA methylase IME4